MYYEPEKRNHGLARDPFKALVVPRPIGWVSSLSADGICNLAPYSFFNAVATRPPYVMFASEAVKDSMRNVEETGEFVLSLATWGLRDHMNVTSAPVPPGADEFPLAGLTAVASTTVKPPRVKESPVSMECVFWKTVAIPGPTGDDEPSGFVVFGKVVGIHIDDAYIRDGFVDTGAMEPIARLGYMDYAVVNSETIFTLNRPEVDACGEVTSPSAERWDGTYR